jgi:hypothetical protein
MKIIWNIRKLAFKNAGKYQDVGIYTSAWSTCFILKKSPTNEQTNEYIPWVSIMRWNQSQKQQIITVTMYYIMNF